MEGINKIIDIYKVIFKVNEKMVQLWTTDIFLSFNWWLSIAVFIIPWVVWFMIRKKESTFRLLYAGLIMTFLNSTLESVGNPYGWWNFTPTIPYLNSFYFPTSLSTVPVLAMLTLQFFSKWPPALQATIYSIIISFVTRPFLSWTQLYFQKPVWEYYYFLPIYFVFYLIVYNVSQRNEYTQLRQKGV